MWKTCAFRRHGLTNESVEYPFLQPEQLEVSKAFPGGAAVDLVVVVDEPWPNHLRVRACLERGQVDELSVIGVLSSAGGDQKRAFFLPADQGPVGRRRDGSSVVVETVEGSKTAGNPGDVLERDANETPSDSSGAGPRFR